MWSNPEIFYFTDEGIKKSNFWRGRGRDIKVTLNTQCDDTISRVIKEELMKLD